ncbi:hypothetical protein VCHA53O466_40440 [Vibrio chagasii]|nr:hypothetical protein VCHA53O466_40440 [Vibrio chagasii]
MWCIIAGFVCVVKCFIGINLAIVGTIGVGVQLLSECRLRPVNIPNLKEVWLSRLFVYCV